jgi:hypothetical protein
VGIGTPIDLAFTKFECWRFQIVNYPVDFALFSEIDRSPMSSEGLARRNQLVGDRQSFGCSASVGYTAPFGNDEANNWDGAGGDCEGAAAVSSQGKGRSIKAGVHVSEMATRVIVGRMAGHAEKNGTDLLWREGREMTSGMPFEIGTTLETRNEHNAGVHSR